MNEDEDIWDASNPRNPFYGEHLFKLGKAVDDVRSANGASETAGATTKLVAKTVANTGVVTAKMGWALFKEMAKKGAEAAANKK